MPREGDQPPTDEQPGLFESVHRYTFRSRGDVAQLGEHCVRIAGVRGSSPLISTSSQPWTPALVEGVPDLVMVIAQPAACGACVGKMPIDQPPEAPRMAVDLEVRQLVNDDVVEHRRRAHHQAPAEGQRSAARGTPPPRLLVSNRDSFRCETHLRSTHSDSFLDRRSCAVAQPAIQDLGRRPGFRTGRWSRRSGHPPHGRWAASDRRSRRSKRPGASHPEKRSPVPRRVAAERRARNAGRGCDVGDWRSTVDDVGPARPRQPRPLASEGRRPPRPRR